jgi:hypothetical protein
LITASPADGGPLEEETFGQGFALSSWDGANAPTTLVSDRRRSSARPEGMALIHVGGEV